MYILCGYETWPQTLWKDQVFEGQVLRRIFVSKREEAPRCWRMLHNLHSSPDVTWMIKSTTRLISQAVCREAIKDAYRVSVEEPEGKIPIRGPQYR
jgi:hypothetical protein